MRSSPGQGQRKAVKRRRLNGIHHTVSCANPLSLQPLGNLLLTGGTVDGRAAGLGALARLPDEIVTAIFAELAADDWLTVQAVSRSFLAWSAIEGLWKVEYLRTTNGHLRSWHGSWRDTYLIDITSRIPQHTIGADTVSSDVLYQPILCATYDPVPAFESARSDQGSMRRVDARSYRSCVDLPREPLILTHAIDDWPALHRWTSLAALSARVSESALFRAEAALATLPTYVRYANRCDQDDSPLYLFHAAPLPDPLDGDVGQPRVFDEDLFAALGDHARPDHRWLIVGPARSGSTFHQDPNGTSAWNAVVTGAKGWICFHPSIVPPGVRVSPDWAEVETPLSVAEWLINYLPLARARYGPRAPNTAERGKMVEGVCEAGETVFIPSGWWHLVINLEPSIALTQNYVGVHELASVLRFLRDRPDQISGVRDGGGETESLYDTFVAALDPENRCAGLQGLATLDDRTRARARRKSMWDESETGTSFAFGFEDELGTDAGAL